MKKISSKRFFALVATSLLLMSACQREDVADVSGSAIKFSVNVGENNASPSVETKSAFIMPEVPGTAVSLTSADGAISIPMTCTTSNDASGQVLTKGSLVNYNDDGHYGDAALYSSLSPFRVAAFNGSTTVFNAAGLSPTGIETVTYSDGFWAMPNTYYWPNQTELTFYAYANLPSADYASVAITSSGQTLNHTVPSSTAAQKDILLGRYSGYGYGTGTATIRFDHPLTSVYFKLGTMAGVTAIKSISLNGVYETGSVTQNESDLAASNWTNRDGSTVVHQNPATDADELEIDDTGMIGDPFLLIPQNTADKNVTISMVVVIGGDEVALEAVIDSDNWLANRTNVYVIGYDAPGEIAISVIEDFITGSNTKQNVSAKNTSRNDVAFIRMAIIANWIDSEGNIAADCDFENGDIHDFLNSNWVRYTDGFYYYKLGVRPGEQTAENLFSSYTAPEPPAEGYYLEMTVIAQGVKYDSDLAGAKAAWGDSIPLTNAIEE